MAYATGAAWCFKRGLHKWEHVSAVTVGGVFTVEVRVCRECGEREERRVLFDEDEVDHG